MINPSLQREILSELDKLGSEQQQQVLDFARTLTKMTSKGISGQELLSLAGTIELDDLAVMAKAIEDDCEQVHLSEW
jgi:hypothetical protein